MRLSKGAEFGQIRRVFIPVAPLETWHGFAKVTKIRMICRHGWIAKGPASQRRKRDKSDPQFCAGLQHTQFGLACPQRIFVLHRP